MESIYIDFKNRSKPTYNPSIDFSHKSSSYEKSSYKNFLNLAKQNIPLLPNSFKVLGDNEQELTPEEKSYTWHLNYENENENYSVTVDLGEVIPVDYIFLSLNLFDNIVISDGLKFSHLLDISFQNANKEWITIAKQYNLNDIITVKKGSNGRFIPSKDNHKLIYIGITTRFLKFDLSKVLKDNENLDETEILTKCVYKSNFDKNGMLYFIGTNGLAANEWYNPVLSGRVKLTLSHPMCNSMKEYDIIERELINAFFGGSSPQYVIIDIGPDVKASLTHYTIRHGFHGNNSFLYNYKFCGSVDGKIWDELDSFEGTRFSFGRQSVTLPVLKNQNKFYRYFRILQEGNYYVPDAPNEGSPFICLNGVEFYGTLSHRNTHLKVSDISFSVLSRSSKSIQFKFVDNHDTNGIIYWIGTNGHTKEFENPSKTGLIDVTLSSPVVPKECSKHDVIDRKPNEIYWGWGGEQWVIIDLKEHNFLKCTHFTIRHGLPSKDSYMTNWTFEGSNDKENWDILYVSKEACFKKEFDVVTINIKPTNQYYRYFRIVQKEDPTNLNKFLSVSGIELYGELLFDPLNITNISKSILLKPSKGYEFVYSNDQDINGLLYWIGSKGLTEDYSNPMGIVNLEYSYPVDEQTAKILLDRSSSTVIWGGDAQWVILDLTDEYKLKCTAFTLTNSSTNEKNFLKNWKFQGSNDKKTWTTLYSAPNSPFSETEKSHTYHIKPKSFYRYFRIIQESGNLVELSGIELYGQTNLKYFIKPDKPTKEGYKSRKRFDYVEDLDTNGLLYWIGSSGGSYFYVNPGESEMISISTSHPLVSADMRLYDITSRFPLYPTYWGGSTPLWFCVDLGENCMFSCNAYTLRHGYNRPNSYLCNWKLLASNDGKEWDVLHYGKYTPFKKEYDTCTFKVKPNSKFYRYFKVVQEGNYSMSKLSLGDDGSPCMCINAFELYGEIEVSLSSPSKFLSLRLGIPLKNVPKTLMFSHSTDFDKNGLIYWLGTEGLTTNFKTPSRRGIVTLTTSHQNALPDGANFHQILSRNNDSEIYWGGSSPQWFCIDIGEQNSFMCNAYTIKHGRSSNDSFISNWKLQGSNDNEEWITLHSVEETPFTKAHETITFKFKPIKFFRYFRIIQNENSSGEPYLSIGGFEMYGLKNYSIVKRQKQISHSLYNSIREFQEILYYNEDFHEELLSKDSIDEFKLNCIQSIKQHHLNVPERIKKFNFEGVKVKEVDIKPLKKPKKDKKKKECSIS